MTTLTSQSSSELSGPNWIRIVALYGVGPLLAFLLVVWLTQRVDADQRELLTEQRATKALIERHIAGTHAVLDRIAKLQYASCKNGARTREASNLCEVGR